MTLTATSTLLFLLVGYVVGFSYYTITNLNASKRRETLNSVNDHAFGDYVDDNLHTLHRRIDDLETVLEKPVAKAAAIKAVNTSRGVAKKAAAKKVAKKAPSRKK